MIRDVTFPLDIKNQNLAQHPQPSYTQQILALS